MPTFRSNRSDDLVLKDGNIGINTSSPDYKLDIADGNTKGIKANVTGVATFSSYSGYLKSNQNIVDNRVIKDSSSTLSGEIIVGAGKTLIVSESSEVGQGNILSLKVSNTFNPPIGSSDERPSAPQQGALFYNKDFRTIEYWDGNFWRQVDNITRRGRGVFGGGQPAVSSGVQTTEIDYIDISSQGNASSFGDLTVSRRSMGCFSSATRGVWGGGRAQTPGWTEYNTMDYVTLASEGNAIDFGDRLLAEYSMGGFSSSTRGIIYGGAPASDDIHYTEIATLGNEVDFGSLITGRRYSAGCASATRGLMGGGHPDAKSSIEFITIASKGNANSFGDLTVGRYGPSACASATRGIFAAGNGSPIHQKVIDYVTIASTGIATDFGNLRSGTIYGAMTASQTRGVYAGGYVIPSSVNTIDYITIATAGDAIDFGDLTHIVYLWEGCSDSHGGLGGF